MSSNGEKETPGAQALREAREKLRLTNPEAVRQMELDEEKMPSLRAQRERNALTAKNFEEMRRKKLGLKDDIPAPAKEAPIAKAAEDDYIISGGEKFYDARSRPSSPSDWVDKVAERGNSAKQGVIRKP